MADRKPRRARINGYPIDLVKTEEIRMGSKITDHPAESGSDFTDNIQKMPLTISMECLISDTPIGEIATDPTRQLDVIEDEDGSLGESVPLPSEDAHQRLMTMWNDELPVEVECSRGVFKNCAIEDIGEVSDASTGGGLSFSIKFKQIRIIENTRSQAKVAIQMPCHSEQDLGLSIDKLVDAKNVLWRKGKPPGLAPFTTPAGVITGTEVVYIIGGGNENLFAGGSPSNKSQYFHSDKKTPLTTQELQDFTKDLNRDASLLTRRGLQRVQNTVDKGAARIKRANDLLEQRKAGKFVDPALFGK